MKVLKVIILYPITFLMIFLLMLPSVCRSQDFNFKGQISLWGTETRSQSEWNENSGIRYIPQFNYSYSLSENNLLNTEILFNTYYETNFTN